MDKKITLDGKYEIGRGLGGWAKSYEHGVKKGDVRMIGNKLMFAQYIYPKVFRKSEINWNPVDSSLTYEDLFKWVNSL